MSELVVKLVEIVLAFILGWVLRSLLVTFAPATIIDNKCADCGTHHALDCKQIQ